MSRETLFVGGPLDGQIRILEANAPIVEYVEYVDHQIRRDHYVLRHFMAFNPDAPWDGGYSEGWMTGKGAVVLNCWTAFAEGWE